MDDVGGKPDAADVVKEVVRRFCMEERTARFGPFLRADGSASGPSLVPLIEGRLYSARLVDAEKYPVDVQVYVGLEELGGLLWEQEMRVLMRVGTSGQNGMPTILGGGYIDEDDVRRAAPGSWRGGVGIIATRGAAFTLDSPGALDYMREDPLRSIRQFAVLAEALSTLHDLGINHRNLWPGTVNATDSDPVRLSLARFELSALLENLMRGSPVDAAEDGAALRRLYRSQGPRALAFAPRERWSFLFSESGHEDPSPFEDERTDVFSLGCIVWEWFLGPMPAADLPAQTADDAATVARLKALHDAMRSKLNAAASLPPVFRRIIGGMLDPDPLTRSTSAEVVDALSNAYEQVVATWDGSDTTKPYLVGFMPTESAPTVMEWEWITHPPDSREGKEELRQFLEDDLRRGILIESPDGAAPFIESHKNAKAKREAKYVLLGRRGAWFCILFRAPGFAGREGLGPPMPQLLTVKYVLKRDRPSTRAGLAMLSASGFRRQLPTVKAVAVDIDQASLQNMAAAGPSWVPLLTAVHPVRQVKSAERKFREAIDWLLEFQGVELRARTYPYRHITAGARVHEIELDVERDRQWLAQSTMLTHFAKLAELRPSLGDFFGSLDEDSGAVEVELVHDDRGRPARGPGTRIQARVLQQTGADRIKVEVASIGMNVPASGWIRPTDLGSRTALERQLVGRWDLLARPALFAQLQKPMSFRFLPRRWTHVGKDLAGDGGPAVRSILTYEPFYAVQGPPGTGKTTVAAEAVANYLRANPANRVLVSAQSNYALDNLATRILSRLKAIDADGNPSGHWDGVALRISSRSAEVDENMRSWQWENLAERRFKEIKDRAKKAAQGLEEAPVTEVSRWLGRWSSELEGDRADELLSELADRTRRAANLVFATCSMATAENVTADGVRATVDWVVVEEAAKAWPTELIVPMARGARWTLIGDHKQLPAHRRQDIERFLDSCLGDEEADLALDAASREDYLRVFDLFGSFFVETPKASDDDVPRPRQADPPLMTLRAQFRMRDPIAQVVSRCFYPVDDEPLNDGLPAGKLRTGHEIAPADLDSPLWLTGTDLAWIDTGALPWCSDEPQWCNRGEAKIVAELVDQLRPVHQPPWGASREQTLAVLSPYRKQNEILRGYGSVTDHLSTVHAFQGREADVVVVSLVRDTMRSPRGEVSPTASLGHLVSPNLANVLFSRAKQLLVLVGNFDHFAAFSEGAGGFWANVCRAVSLYGRIIPAENHFHEGR